MNIEKIFIGNEETKELEYQGEKFAIKVRPVTWAQKSTITHKCMSYSKGGEAHFDYGRYAEEMLVAMITEAPWGKTDHLFLKRIKPEFGVVLEKLIPPPMEAQADESDFFENE